MLNPFSIRAGKPMALILVAALVETLVALSVGCASVSYTSPSGAAVRRTVPIWSTKTALGEFSMMERDTNGVIREVKVLNHSQENTESIGNTLGTALGAALKAYSGGPAAAGTVGK